MKVKKYCLVLIILFGFLMLPALVLADDYGLSDTAQAAELDTSTELPTLIGNIIGTGLSMIGVIFFALMVYGGILWMTARGNEEISKKASNTIIAAVIGIIIVLSSYAITNFVLGSVESTQESPPIGGTN